MVETGGTSAKRESSGTIEKLENGEIGGEIETKTHGVEIEITAEREIIEKRGAEIGLRITGT